MTTNALVLFSGGQDSAVCLAWALRRFEHVETIGFEYGQRHAVEMACRQDVLSAMRESYPEWSKKLGEDHIVDLAVLGRISETALTRESEIEMTAGGLPSTFVPGRNLMFLTLAGAVAYRRGANLLVGGMCETDFSGYPDCRRDTIDAMGEALRLGLARDIEIATPLMYLTKADTWSFARDIGGDKLVEIIRVKTHTCYLGDRSELHDWGYGCGTCPACELRAKGWREFAAA